MAEDSPGPVPGLPGARTVSLERVPIRTRESVLTRSAWRLTVAANAGEGSIVRIEVDGEATLHRGDGVFLGWSTAALASAYEALRPKPDEAPLDLPQLG